MRKLNDKIEREKNRTNYEYKLNLDDVKKYKENISKYDSAIMIIDMNSRCLIEDKFIVDKAELKIVNPKVNISRMLTVNQIKPIDVKKYDIDDTFEIENLTTKDTYQVMNKFPYFIAKKILTTVKED